jgi:hypothetical protein
MINYDLPFMNDAGVFYLPETKKYFTFRPTTDAWALKHDIIHAIDVLDGVRFGVVRNTVAYVATDEDQYGNPILDRWIITKRKVLSKPCTA